MNALYLSKLKDVTIIKTLKENFNEFTEEKLYEIYLFSIHLRQKNIQSIGFSLEKSISKLLQERGVPFKQQVYIDKNGVIVFERKHSIEIIDFVIGKVDVGKPIQDLIVVSTKTSCRERWKQDDWTKTIPPKKYILACISKDYPPSQNFEESEKRKIITCYPKKKDKRLFKLNYDDLMTEIDV